MQAKDIMSSPVMTIHPDAIVEEAAKLMLQHGVSCLVVTDASNHIAGILTHSDFGLHRKLVPLADNLYQLLGSWAVPNMLEEIAQRVRTRQVKDVMTGDVEVVSEDASVAEVAAKMLRRRVNRLPVVRGRELVGIITRHDLLKVMVDQGPSSAPRT